MAVTPGQPTEVETWILGTLLPRQLGTKAEGYTRDMTAADMGADSLDFVEMVMAIEDYYGFEIPDESCEHWTTPAQAIEYVNVRVHVGH